MSGRGGMKSTIIPISNAAAKRNFSNQRGLLRTPLVRKLRFGKLV
jgi:hypothetical protein